MCQQQHRLSQSSDDVNVAKRHSTSGFGGNFTEQWL